MKYKSLKTQYEILAVKQVSKTYFKNQLTLTCYLQHIQKKATEWKIKIDIIAGKTIF